MSLWSLGTTTVLRGNHRTAAALDATSPPTPANSASTALASLAKYIPAETTTAFIAALGLISAISLPEPDPLRWEWALYVVCVVLTPLYVYLAARATWHSNDAAAAPFVPPTWRMAAATVAFGIWALAVPGLIPEKSFVALAGVGAILVSPIIVFVEKAFDLDS